MLGNTILSIARVCAIFLGIGGISQPARAIDASIVVDANTDTVISQFNADRLLHPASMSKLMTLYLTFEALEQGRITLQRNLPVSEHAASMSPTKLGLQPGETIRVQDAILSLVTLSANDAAVVLGEALGGSEDRFGQLMTRKAHQLGMVNTNFRNANGLPDPAQISTARDMAILCRALIKRFPSYYHYFSVREFTYNGIEYANHNHLMDRYEGMDGLKTGLTTASGFNLAASAVRNGRRLIGVVFGGTSAIQRDDYMAEILDDGFRRTGGEAMTTALPPPVPGHKPADLLAATPTSEARAEPRLPPTPVPLTPAPTVNIPDERQSLLITPPTGIGALAGTNAGQGDVEAPEDYKPSRGAPEPAAHLSIGRQPAATPAKPLASKGTPATQWGIQVGAYGSRSATEKAIQEARRRAPVLDEAKAEIMPLSNPHGTMYRARLTGLAATEARKACHLLSHCQLIPPGAS